jgi:formyltetrahydrofolate deformylase
MSAASPTRVQTILTASCPDTTGIVAAVAGFLASAGLFITGSAHVGDADSGRFFLRSAWTTRASATG